MIVRMNVKQRVKTAMWTEIETIKENEFLSK